MCYLTFGVSCTLPQQYKLAPYEQLFRSQSEIYQKKAYTTLELFLTRPNDKEKLANNHSLLCSLFNKLRIC